MLEYYKKLLMDTITRTKPYLLQDKKFVIELDLFLKTEKDYNEIDYFRNIVVNENSNDVYTILKKKNINKSKKFYEQAEEYIKEKGLDSRTIIVPKEQSIEREEGTWVKTSEANIKFYINTLMEMYVIMADISETDKVHIISNSNPNFPFGLIEVNSARHFYNSKDYLTIKLVLDSKRIQYTEVRT